MKTLANLFDNNRNWVKSLEKNNPDFFKKLSRQQNPEYLWIGCSDSRVPANDIVGLLPGELFVHRNIANLVMHSDMNCISVIQFAVEILKIKHIIVCGHYGCGGVTASIEDKKHGIVDNWTRIIKDLYYEHKQELSKFKKKEDLINRLCELNVTKQVYNVCSTNILLDSWRNGQDISVHGWIYGIENGLLKDLGITVSSRKEFDKLVKEKFS